MADKAKDLMTQNLGGSGDDKDKKDAPAAGGTHVLPPSDVPDLDGPSVDPSKTVKVDQPQGGPTDDDQHDDADAGDTNGDAGEGNLDDKASGGSGDSGGNQPPAPPSGGDDGKADAGGGDGKPVNEILAAMMVVKDKLAILVPAHEKANEMQDTIGVLLQRLKMYEANPPSDLDLTALKALVATIAAMVDAGHGRIEAAHKRPELDAALAYLKG